MNINPKLEPGDKIILLSMKDESMMPGTKGVVKQVQHIFGDDLIYVNWENGRTLSLISSLDAWTKDEPKKIAEDYNSEWLMKNLDIANFNTITLVNFLIKVKESGITNMLGAAPYLWMGKERIEHQFAYEDFDEDRQEKFDEMVDMADEAQAAMINGCIKILEKEKK